MALNNIQTMSGLRSQQRSCFPFYSAEQNEEICHSPRPLNQFCVNIPFGTRHPVSSLFAIPSHMSFDSFLIPFHYCAEAMSNDRPVFYDEYLRLLMSHILFLYCKVRISNMVVNMMGWATHPPLSLPTLEKYHSKAADPF